MLYTMLMLMHNVVKCKDIRFSHRILSKELLKSFYTRARSTNGDDDEYSFGHFQYFRFHSKTFETVVEASRNL